MRASVPDAIALHCGYPGKDLLPERLVRGALARAARTEAALMRSPARRGYPSCRRGSPARSPMLRLSG